MENKNRVLDYEDEFVNPDEYLASAGARFANYLIDRIGVYVFIFSLISLMGSVREFGEFETGFDLLLLFVLLFGYWIIFEYLFGKTPGKFITRTKVVTKNGERPSFLQIVGRTLCRFIPFEQFSFLGSRAIGWHDSISKTRVVRDSYQSNEENYV